MSVDPREELALLLAHLDEEPADAQRLARHPARWMLWEGPPRADTAERLEALGVRSAVFAPGAAAPESGDFLSVMEANAAALESIAR